MSIDVSEVTKENSDIDEANLAYHTDSSSDESDSYFEGTVDVENNIESHSDIEGDVQIFFFEPRDFQLALVYSMANKEISSPSIDSTPFSTFNPIGENKEKVIIGGRSVEWESILEFLTTMNLKLVPNDGAFPESGNKQVRRRKKGERELRNLYFGINYDKIVGAKRFSSLK